MSIRDFLRTYQVKLEFTNHSLPQALCDGDEFIMDALRSRTNCSPSQLQRLNACRMHLRVSRLSEIASANGTLIRRDSLKGTDSAIHLSETRWPRQARPLAADWTFWSKMLRTAFSITGDNHTLRSPLGQWYSDLDLREWPTLMSAPNAPRQAYCRLPDGNYEVFDEVEGRKYTQSFWVSRTASADVVDSVPFDAVPAEMQMTSKAKNLVRCKVMFRGKQSAPPSREEPTSFQEYVAQQPTHVSRLLRDCDLSEIVTQNLVSLIESPNTLSGGTYGGLLLSLIHI